MRDTRREFSLEPLEGRVLLSSANARVTAGPVPTHAFLVDFHVHLPSPPKRLIAYQYHTFDESAKAGVDYVAVSTAPGGSAPVLILQPGQQNADILVPLINNYDPATGFVKPPLKYRDQFGLELDGPTNIAYGIASIHNVHPAIPRAQLNDPVVSVP